VRFALIRLNISAHFTKGIPGENLTSLTPDSILKNNLHRLEVTASRTGLPADSFAFVVTAQGSITANHLFRKED